MKLVRYGDPGRERPGMLDADGRLRDLRAQVADIDGALLAGDGLQRLAQCDPQRLPLVAPNVRLGPCVGAVSKVVGVGMNYRDHAAAAGVAIPKRPLLFMKPTSTVSGPCDDVLIPRGSEHLDWEVELGVVIGRTARDVEPADSRHHLAGYCLVNDLTERAWIEESGQLLEGKSADTFTPIGPWFVTADEIATPQDVDLFLDLNGQRRQTGNTRNMIFDVDYLVSHISKRMTLLPGDIIATGTPAGVGMRMAPPTYLRPGDLMRLGGAGLGEQRLALRARA